MTKITPANDTRHDRYSIVENHKDAGRRYGVIITVEDHLVAAFDHRDQAEQFMREMHAAYDSPMATAKRMGMI